MKYEYVIFDFNGTVLDDVDLCYSILNTLLSERGYKKCESLEKYKTIFTFPIIDYYINAGFDFTKHSFESIANEFIEIYQPNSFKCKIYDGIIKICKKLKNEGYKLILLSASKYENLLEQVNYFQIGDLFDEILGISNIHAKSKLGIAKKFFSDKDASKALFIGDSVHDFEVGKELGGDVILVSYGHQSKEILKGTKVPVIDSIYELEKFL